MQNNLIIDFSTPVPFCSNNCTDKSSLTATQISWGEKFNFTFHTQ